MSDRLEFPEFPPRCLPDRKQVEIAGAFVLVDRIAFNALLHIEPDRIPVRMVHAGIHGEIQLQALAIEKCLQCGKIPEPDAVAIAVKEPDIIVGSKPQTV